jgi:5'(3')-deoxyribonucleotidase
VRVGLDMDGVVYQFENAVRHHLITHRGYQLNQLPDARSWRFFQEWGIADDDFDPICAEAIENGILFTWGEPYEGTAQQLQRLVDDGHTLHVVTARGIGAPGGAEGATKAWLSQYLPPISSLTFSKDKTIVRTDVFLEDKLSNYDALITSGVRATLINRPWNQQESTYPWRRRVDSIEEFVDDTLSLMAVRYDR